MDLNSRPQLNGEVQNSGLPLSTALVENSSTGCDESLLVCFPLHPRDALWKPGLHSLSEHKEIRKWINQHPLDEDGKVQQKLWYHFGRQRKGSGDVVRDPSTTEPLAIGSFSRDRSFDFSPFFRPRSGWTTTLRELGTAVCVDVALDGGIPCMVAVTVEFDAGGCWSSHARLACLSTDFADDSAGVVSQDVVCKELARLEQHLKQSMRTTCRDHSVDDIIRLSVRLSYRMPKDNISVERCVRRRNE